ncbi:MAG: phage tail tape measure protein, partial [Chloroflexi bacterium]
MEVIKISAPFVLTAQIKFQQTTNINTVIRNIQSQLKEITVPVNMTVAPKTNKKLNRIHDNLTRIHTEITGTNAAAKLTSSSLTTMSNAVKGGSGMTKVATAANKANVAVKKVATSTKVASAEMATFGQQSALAIRRFLAFSIPTGIVVSLVVGMKRGFTAAVEFEREMIKVAQVTGKTMTELGNLQTTIGNLSTTFGVASNELAVVSRTLSQAGLSANEVKISLDAIAKSDLAPTFSNMTQTTETVIAAMRQFKIPATEVNRLLSEMNAVAGSFAVEAADLGSVIRRTG